MNYLVTMSKEIDFAPATEVAEIIQNVRTIIATRKGDVPLARDLGFSWGNIDKPLPLAKAMMQAEIIDAIEEIEPRAKIVSVEFEESEAESADGILKPRVIINIEEVTENE